MSVINQMLRDLDARGGVDPARRAAIAAVGQGRPVPRLRGGRAGAWAVGIALLAAVAALVGLAIARFGGNPPVPATPAGDGAGLPRAAAAEPSAPPPAATPPAATLSPASTPGPAAAVSAPAEPAAPDTPSAPVAAAPTPTPAASAPSPPHTPAAPPSAPTPAAVPRARIEVVRAEPVDPLLGAREHLAEGDAAAALSALDALSPGDRGGPEAEALAAAALQQLGRHDAAIGAYTRALRDEPDIGAWWSGLGISLEAAGRAGEALQAYREAQRRGPLDPALADYVGARVEALSAGDPTR
jgi:hypothetical protein